ncbi:MAG: protein-arginine deiminase family protein, partial [Pyrinomonadaceae bacterium]
AVQYPDKTFGGEITITFRIEKGSSTQTENAALRVAPWVHFTHLDPTRKVYLVETGDNSAFIGEISTEATAAGVPPLEKAAGRYKDDRWLQDAMEVGFSTLPKTKPKADWNLPVVLRTANDRMLIPAWRSPLDQYPKSEMLGPGYGFTQALPPMIGTSLDSFGNLECSPPFTHSGTGKEYKFGRIVYGMDPVDPTRDMQAEVRDFLHAQQVQEPFWIDTGWLIVGHVDEVISFCPMKNAPHKFKVLLASPKRAVDILTDLKSKGNGGAPLFQGIKMVAGGSAAGLAASYPRRTVNAILGDAALMAAQTTAQGHMGGIKTKIKTELGLSDSDFIDFPILFKEEGGRYVAYTPGSVNMLVLTKADKTARMCIPKPFGPVVGGNCKFEEVIKSDLGPVGTTGVEPKFIDDFWTYHVAYGEIHCGTNSKRDPPTDRFWWEQKV